MVPARAASGLIDRPDEKRIGKMGRILDFGIQATKEKEERKWTHPMLIAAKGVRETGQSLETGRRVDAYRSGAMVPWRCSCLLWRWL